MNRTFRLILLAMTLMANAAPSRAGVDIWGVASNIQIAPDGTLWFAITNNPEAAYCKAGWAGLNMLIPPTNPQYPYYYGMLMTSLTKGRTLLLANISSFNGSTACDITQTSYGMVLY